LEETMTTADDADALLGDPRALARLLADTIDVEARLRAVKAAANGPHRLTTPARDTVLVASAGAAAALLVYLRWRARRPIRGVPHARARGARRGLRGLLHRSAGGR
jgi:hypothetical protein